MARLDVTVAEITGFSRAYAQEIIKEGLIKVDGKPIIKPAYIVADGENVKIFASPPKFVGRGGYKLDGALEAFKTDVSGFVCTDAGASTGGFVDCLLQRGAARVYAVDVGSKQLSPKLRGDYRVISVENMDIRDFIPPESIDFLTADLSFISVEKVAESFVKILRKGGRALCLVKPQFEAGKGRVGKGVVRDEKIRLKAVEGAVQKLAAAGFRVIGAERSVLAGGDGNVEYFVYSEKL